MCLRSCSLTQSELLIVVSKTFFSHLQKSILTFFVFFSVVEHVFWHTAYRLHIQPAGGADAGQGVDRRLSSSRYDDTC